MARGRGGFIGQDGLNAPDSPTGVSASAGDAQATDYGDLTEAKYGLSACSNGHGGLS